MALIEDIQENLEHVPAILAALRWERCEKKSEFMLNCLVAIQHISKSMVEVDQMPHVGIDDGLENLVEGMNMALREVTEMAWRVARRADHVGDEIQAHYDHR